MRRFARLLKQARIKTIKVNVRYDLSIKKLVEIANFNGDVNADINDERFPEEKCPKEKNKKAILINVSEDVTKEEAEAVMKHFHFRPATLKELLSFRVDHPRLPWRYPIVAFGVSCQRPNGYWWWSAAYLNCCDMRLGWPWSKWNALHWFLAFRES